MPCGPAWKRAAARLRWRTPAKFASAAAYGYLGCRDRWARIQEALDHAGLLHGVTDDDLPLLGARH